MTDHPEHSIPGWLELHDLSLHADSEARTPYGPYIIGMVGPGHRFHFKGTISGNSIDTPPGFQGTPGWVELNTISFHQDFEAVQPHPPFVHGVMDNTHHFYPDEPFKIVFGEEKTIANA